MNPKRRQITTKEITDAIVNYVRLVMDDGIEKHCSHEHCTSDSDDYDSPDSFPLTKEAEERLHFALSRFKPNTDEEDQKQRDTPEKEVESIRQDIRSLQEKIYPLQCRLFNLTGKTF